MTKVIASKSIGDAQSVAVEGIGCRIKNVQGQLDGVMRMIGEEADCVAVLTQFKAARAGFDRAFALFLEENLKKCVGVNKLTDTKKAEVESILAALAK